MAAGNNITLPEDLLAEVARAAAEEHKSVDQLVADAAQQYLKSRSWTEMLWCGHEHAKALGIQESDVDRLITEYRAEKRSR